MDVKTQSLEKEILRENIEFGKTQLMNLFRKPIEMNKEVYWLHEDIHWFG